VFDPRGKPITKSVKPKEIIKAIRRKKTPSPKIKRKGERNYLGKGEEKETRELLEIPEKKETVFISDPRYDKYIETGFTGKDRGMPSKVPSFGIPKQEVISSEQFRQETVVPWQEVEETYVTRIADVKRAAKEGIGQYEVTLESGKTVRWDWRKVVSEYERQLTLIRTESTKAQLGMPPEDTKIIKKITDSKVEYGFIPRDPSLDWSKARIEAIERMPPPLFTAKGFAFAGLSTIHTFASVIKMPFEWVTGKKYPHYTTWLDVPFEPLGLSPPGSAELAKRTGAWGAVGTGVGEFLLFKGIGAGIKGTAFATGKVGKWYIRKIASAYSKFTKIVPEEHLLKFKTPFKPQIVESGTRVITGKVVPSPTSLQKIYSITEKVRFKAEFPGRAMTDWARGKLVFMKEYPLVAEPQVKTVGGIRFEIAKYSGFGRRTLVPTKIADQIKGKVLGAEGAVWLRGTPSRISSRFEATKIRDIIKVKGRFKKTILDVKASIRQRYWEIGDIVPYDYLQKPKMKLVFGQMYYFTPTTTIKTTGRPMVTGGLKHFGELGGKTITVPITTSLTLPTTALGYGMAKVGATGIISARKTDVVRTPMDVSITGQLPALTPIQAQDAVQLQKQLQKQTTALRMDTITVPASQRTKGLTSFATHVFPAPVKVRIPFIFSLEGERERKKHKKLKPIDWTKGYRERKWKVLSMEELVKGVVKL